MAGDARYTLGIDLASQPENTAVCLLGWEPDRCEVLALHRGATGSDPLDDDTLLALMLAHRGEQKIGIDAPLGWPVAFVAAVSDPERWPLVEEVEPVTLVRRATDRWIQRETGKVPLSVSTDRIAYPAMRAVRLLRRLAGATGWQIDRSGVSGPVCEVYPDPSTGRFGLWPAGAGRRPSYKLAGGREQRAGMVARLRLTAPWLGLSDAQAAACVEHDDSLDALVAALVARAVAMGLTEPPPGDMAAEAASEGWIHIPRPGGLPDLAPHRT